MCIRDSIKPIQIRLVLTKLSENTYNLIMDYISKELRQMKDIIFDSFQNDVSESLLRHKSILDILTKYTESSCRINRAVAKAVTNCGCIEINATKQCLPDDDN